MLPLQPSWDDLHEIASSQSGHFTAQQAGEAGFSGQLLHKHVQNGNLGRPLRGIYRISRFPPSELEDLVVLWLWSAQEAVFSHETAMQLHELSDALPARVHMTMPTATSRRKKHPKYAVLHFADIPQNDRQWLGPIQISTAARCVLDVAAAKGDASLVAQAIDQGIRTGLFTFEQVAPAGRYVANAQGWGGAGSRAGFGDGSGYGGGAGFGDGSGYGGGFHEPFYTLPISGNCAEPPPSDWPTLAAELGRDAGAELRAAQYLPSRTMLLEFAWRPGRAPNRRVTNTLRRQLTKKFSWA